MQDRPNGSSIFDADGKQRPQVDFNLVTLESLRIPEVKAAIPQLQRALEAWRFQDNSSLLFGRIQTLQRAHLAMDFVVTVYKDLSEREHPLLMVSHEPGFSLEENAAALKAQEGIITEFTGEKQIPPVLKTVSVGFPITDDKEIALVSGAGDFRVGKETKRAIAKELGLPASAAKNSGINPGDFDIALFLGLIPGMLKPIIQPHLIGAASAVAYMHLTQDSKFVAIITSPIDSMIMLREDFEAHLTAYSDALYVGFEHRSTEGFEIWQNKRNQK
ncbi:hypothetical protein HY030_01355 [Candidatus Gottesmanbacteria bacterium]|nr:hypothetical protein [Candidatus Gottesmanbacteria bacterium]